MESIIPSSLHYLFPLVLPYPTTCAPFSLLSHPFAPRKNCSSSGTATTRGPDMFERSSCSSEGEEYTGPQCTAVVRCAQGKLVVHHCTGGLVWNPNQAMCDWPSRVPLCKGVILTTASEGSRKLPTHPNSNQIIQFPFFPTTVLCQPKS